MPTFCLCGDLIVFDFYTNTIKSDKILNNAAKKKKKKKKK